MRRRRCRPIKAKTSLRVETLEPRQLMAGDMVLDWNDIIAETIRADTTQPGPKPSQPTQGPSTSVFPTAKGVPDKPGYVFSPFDSSGRYVDVSGYTPGTKVKDPWTDKIFVVP